MKLLMNTRDHCNLLLLMIFDATIDFQSYSVVIFFIDEQLGSTVLVTKQKL